ncbi:hypothetical protein ACFP1I_28265 [Dyadobacter subterraneus]|uniref:Uncharacterized protein n=2 Tax=Dyadobacter subterraneus TaxID=2773304 RepID=A0ABR9WCW9_9BACT|nr:hypothetical protein [Dyadobacter subterraneus]MBE9463262.1 hypothetical protein [Dyadobacter subterraneus]
MKKLISISFLMIYLLSTSELVELVKLPVLLHHFQQHKKWDSSITFFEFLTAHYAESITDNADYDLDKKLPFKTNTDHTSGNIWIAPMAVIQSYIFKINPSFFLQKQVFTYKDGALLSFVLSNIWQPPKSL